MSNVTAVTAAVQAEVEADEDFEQGDVVVEFITVAVFQNFETGHTGTYIMTSNEDAGRPFPAYRAKGLLVDALDIIRSQESCRCGDDD